MNLKLVFYAEVLINTITLLLCFFSPGKFIEQLVTVDYNLFAAELARWYGLVLLLLSGIMLTALRQKTFHFLRIVLLINLPGDIIQVALTVHTAHVFNRWTAGLIFTIVVCTLLFVTRVAVLKKPGLAGYENAG